MTYVKAISIVCSLSTNILGATLPALIFPCVGLPYRSGFMAFGKLVFLHWGRRTGDSVMPTDTSVPSPSHFRQASWQYPLYVHLPNFTYPSLAISYLLPLLSAFHACRMCVLRRTANA